MAEVILQHIDKIYPGDVKAVDDVNVHVKDKEFVVLVGPSGCGKSTTLRMVAGLEEITNGDLIIDGDRVNEKAPKDRDIAMVFQNYALYPHMTVFENMAFGLRLRKYPKDQIDARVNEAAQILDIENLLQRKPKQMSGGQRQRVAVGRAIVRHPKVFLFDEPLSNLDAKLRVQMRAEISSLHTRLQATMMYVTHDQIEAMTMGDKIVVMKDGIVQQIGSPLHLYNQPFNRFVATFMGTPPMNVVTAEVKNVDGKIVIDEGKFIVAPGTTKAEVLKDYVGKKILMGIRPEDVIPTDSPDPNLNIEASVEVVEPLGAETNLWLGTGNHQLVVRTGPEREYHVGGTVNFKPIEEKVQYFDIETEKNIFYKAN